MMELIDIIHTMDMEILQKHQRNLQTKQDVIMMPTEI